MGDRGWQGQTSHEGILAMPGKVEVKKTLILCGVKVISEFFRVLPGLDR